ncbi:MAG: protein kinase [Planctomycetaceae bacterium]|mgnify:CR=1 FL=1|jgi:eukaryotic-like serine/threonine-protein kinase|nr:protein kinase [Planctomycetaceae bacterium]MBT6496038.1 protein kinase [Planctomycetaceae bacterium]
MTTQIKTRCEHCGQALGVAETQFGTSVRCPICDKEFVVSSVLFSKSGQPGQSAATAAPSEVGPGGGQTSNHQQADVLRNPITGTNETIGRFQILGRLGGGTYGVVFHAYDPVLDRQLALKIPRFEADGPDVQVARRFQSEAKAAARLRHPGIVSIFETGQTDGRYYIAAEYVEGTTLRARIEAGVPPFSITARWIAELAGAIDYAHAEGVVHRDLKPENILLDTHERPQILDFGLAKRLDEDSSLTTEGSILGTPAYMSPEQARGDVGEVGPASDQYSLGAILYELLTGMKAFHGPPHAVVAQVAADDPPQPCTLNPNVPRDLEAICRQAMEKESARRYRNCGELAEDLQRWLSGRETKARPLGIVEQAVRWGRRRPAAAIWSAIFAVTFIAAFSLVAWQWQRAETLRRRAAANFLEAHTMRNAALQNASELKRQRDLAEKRATELAKQRSQLVKQEQALKDALAVAELNLAESLRQKQRADATSIVASRESKRAAVNIAKANQQQQKAQKLLAGDYIDLGLRLCEEGRVGTGMLWQARSLSVIPEDHPAEYLIRANLAVYRRQFHQLLSAMKHDSPIVSATNLAGSRLLLTGCEDGSVHLWDSATQTQIIEPLQFAGSVTATAADPEAKLIFIGTSESVAQIWNLETGQPQGRPLKHPDTVTSAAFSPDGKLLLTGCKDRRARVWGTKQGRLVASPMEHQGAVSAVAFSHDGKRILTGSAGVQNQVTLWNPINGQLISVLGTDPKPVRAVAFSLDGDWLAAGGDSGGARIWNAKTGQPLAKPCQTQGAVLSLAFSPNGDCLLTGSSAGTTQLWNVADATRVGQSLQHTHEVRVVTFAESGKSIATAGEDGNLRVWWNAFAAPKVGTIRYNAKVLDIAVTADGRSLATAGEDRTARIWDLPTGLPIGPPLQHAEPVTAVAFSPDGKYLASGGRDNTVRLWNVENAQRVAPRMDHDRPLTLVRFSPSGKVLLTATESGIAQLWNVASGKSLRLLQQHRSLIVAAAFSHNGQQLLTGSSDRSARVWHMSAAKTKDPVLQHDDGITAVAFSPVGTLAATASADHTVRIWNATSGEAVLKLQHVAGVASVSFHPNGRWLLTACADGGAYLWDVKTGMEVRKALRHQSALLTAQFIRDGNMMFTADTAGTVSLWDTATGRRIGLPWESAGGLTQAHSTPNGAAMVVVSKSGSVFVQSVPGPVDEPAAGIELWTQVVTGQELDKAGLTSLLKADELLRRQRQIVAETQLGIDSVGNSSNAGNNSNAEKNSNGEKQ